SKIRAERSSKHFEVPPPSTEQAVAGLGLETHSSRPFYGQKTRGTPIIISASEANRGNAQLLIEALLFAQIDLFDDSIHDRFQLPQCASRLNASRSAFIHVDLSPIEDTNENKRPILETPTCSMAWQLLADVKEVLPLQ